MNITHNPDPIVRVKDAAAFLGISARTVHYLQSRGELPPPIVISYKAKGWRRSVLQSWLDSRECRA